MNNQTKTRTIAGATAIVIGVTLIGTTGLTFALGWAMWAVGLGVVLAAVPSAGENRRGGGRRNQAAAHYSPVR
jgi:hypothetical protein